MSLHVEYAGGETQYGILFIVSLFHEYSNLEYVHIHAIYKVNQEEYAIRILVAASQKYVNTYSTSRTVTPLSNPINVGYFAPPHMYLPRVNVNSYTPIP